MILTILFSFLLAVAVSIAAYFWRNIVCIYDSCSQAATFVSTFKWETTIALVSFLLGLALIAYSPYVFTGLDVVYETVFFRAEQVLVNFLANPVKTGYRYLFYDFSNSLSRAVAERWNDVVIYYRTSLYTAITEIQALMQINSIQKVTQVFDIIYTMIKAFMRVTIEVPSLHIKYFTDAVCTKISFY